MGGSGGCLPAGRRKPQGPRARRMRPRPPGARRGSPARRRDAHQASRTASCRGGTIPAGKAPRPTGSAERYSVGSRNSHTPNGPRAPGPRSAPPPRPDGPQVRRGTARAPRAAARCAIRSLTWRCSLFPAARRRGGGAERRRGRARARKTRAPTVASVRLRRTAPSRPAGVLPHLQWGRGRIPIAVAQRRVFGARPRSAQAGSAFGSPACAQAAARAPTRPRSCSSWAIWTALSAAPLRRLSETHQNDRPCSTVGSERMRLT